jgi:ABC-type Na+ efflux pump permease subunit
MAEPDEKAPGEVRHTGQAVVRLILFAIVVLMLAGLVWALVRMASRPATMSPTMSPATVTAFEQPTPRTGLPSREA